MQDILKEEMGEQREYAFLSGPSFAREIATGLATAVVVASENDRFANQVAELFGCETFRVFTSRDVVGVEIGGAVKNVIAIAAGMAEGLGLGTNAMAGLVTRGCLEMQTLARSLVYTHTHTHTHIHTHVGLLLLILYHKQQKKPRFCSCSKKSISGEKFISRTHELTILRYSRYTNSRYSRYSTY